MGLTLTLLSSLWLAYELSLRLWRERFTSGERAFYTITLAVLLWLASAWLIAMLQLLSLPWVLARTILFLAVAAGLTVVRRPRLRRLEFQRRTLILTLTAALPVLVWADFVLWRGLISPPLNHDALSYHLPKAAMYVQAHGYEPLVDLRYVMPSRPSNYEILLADAIALDGTDRYTEWPGMLFYLALVAAAIAIVQRWWDARLETVLAVGLMVAAVPVALLHAGAHKNDLLFTLFALAGAMAAGRFWSSTETASLCLAVASLAALCGTKRHGVIVAACVFPLLAWRLVRPLAWRRLAGAAGVAVLAGLLLGGVDELARYRDSRQASAATPAAASEGGASYPYGDWANLWQAPYILLMSPFSSDPRALKLPWLETPMFWQRYELFFSHFGIHFSMAVLLLPLAVVASRRKCPEMSAERIAVTLSLFAAFLLLLPVNFIPRGLYAIYLPRFVLFVVPIVFAWTVAPLIEVLVERRRDLAAGAVAAAALTFTAYATSYSINDRFVPIEYVLWASEHPDNRIIPFFPHRAASIVDRMAGPRDSIAFDAGNAAWIYPAFGARLERRIQFIPPGEGPPPLPDVDWIVVERSWNAIWGDPAFQDLSQAHRFLVRGRVQPQDRRVLLAAAEDPRYRLVFNDPRLRQAVFQRVRPTP